LMKATLALIKKVADELSEKGTYNILSDTFTPLPEAVLAYKMAIGLNILTIATNCGIDSLGLSGLQCQ